MAGTLVEILVGEGQTVPVEAVVARLETEVGAGAATTDGAGPEAVGRPAAPVAAAVGTAAVTPAQAPPPSPPAPPARPPSRVPAHAATASAGARGPGDSRKGGLTQAPGGNGLEERLRTKSSPLVRKMAAEHGIELGSLTGSGIAGRVTKRDLQALLESGAIPTSGAAAGLRGAAEVHGPIPEPWPGDVVEPMSKMRRLISEHMVFSRHTSAHVTSIFEVDLTRVARLRARKKAEFEAASGHRLTYLPFIIKAVVDGLKTYPIVNASVAGHNVIYRKQINVGIAVALDWGLIVPVIKHADGLSLVGITRALNDLADRARTKRLQPEEVQDGTFTITNPGVFGSLTGTPIINQPQVAILCIGAIEKRPKVLTGSDGEDVIAIRTCSYFSLTFDHRLIDGAVADQYLAFVKKQLENFPEAVL
jgi:2-oxoglutarate dehydrogenase E2 component (dihydrolipoamide succinyltransferase)